MKTTFTNFYDTCGNRIFEGDTIINLETNTTYIVERSKEIMQELPKFIIQPINMEEQSYSIYLYDLNNDLSSSYFYNVDTEKHNEDNAYLDLISDVINESERPSLDNYDFFNKVKALKEYFDIIYNHKDDNDDDYVKVFSAKIDKIYREIF